MKYKNFIRRIDLALKQAKNTSEITLEKAVLDFGISHGYITDINGTLFYHGIEIK